MYTFDTCWLPELVECSDLTKYNEYLAYVHSFFVEDFIDSGVMYNNLPVKVNTDIGESGFEKGFEHVVTNDFEKNKKRFPDIPRCERIKWIKGFLENANCKYDCSDFDELCDGIKVWQKRKGSKIRTMLLFEEEKYMVVLERQGKSYYLVTAFYVNFDHAMNKYLKEYDEYIYSKTK